MTQSNRKKILIVDDEEDFVDATACYLQGLGYEVLTAKTGEEALEIVQESMPDLVLLDIIMPQMKGVEVCTNMKAHPATQQIPILFLTAIGAAEHVKVLKSMGAEGYIVKPCRLEELKSQIETCLKRPSSSPSTR